ncbi:Relaxase/Mobilisation nuclease domain-containing protein [Pedobacter westerhofensis]|uniref:Relaxase/Mobilisation nuclease domain-containing protein n=1 Tax=Pedobacter westerhofensis TaxID=425512 RepID=A0A521EEQ9_9SPHI|nr:relaxase/mobilization nuclease domain-containing protein [Pedobacter westerhofensis]SMO82416.1 Relaxase/Mobilisation nuclease domain-containing protein [Pedobacter westerhofensis]
MIGKPITGKSFGGCVRYLLDKPNAKIISAEDIRTKDAKSITQDFNLQRKLRPGLGKAVGHLVLSWSKEDLPKLSDEVMIARAQEYMKKMGIANTQYLVVRHQDREHPHVHIVYNRVNNSGQTITDKNDYLRNIKVCKEITLKYGYHLGEGKDLVNRQALKGKEKLKYELYDGIKTALKQSTSWKGFENKLNVKGIAIAYKYRSGTKEVQGLSFEKGNLKMKGSSVDRIFSFANLDSQLNRNYQVKQYHEALVANKPSLADQLREAIKLDIQSDQHFSHDKGESLLDILFRSGFVPAQSDPVGDAEKRRRKRKQHEAEQSQGVSR